MLQWKPKLIALVVVLVLLAALLGQFTWGAFADQSLVPVIGIDAPVVTFWP